MKNVGILLAAGRSSRFINNIPKQLYLIDKKPIIVHVIEAMNILDEIIIVTNSDCYRQIRKLFGKYSYIDVIKNDIDCRIESIKKAINHINSAKNIIIHDCARPFVKKEHFEILLKSTKTYLCSQFYLKLVNGLIKINENDVEIVDRDKHVELVMPQVIDFRLAKDLFNEHIDLVSCEIIAVLDKLKIKYNLIEGFRDLRKITTKEDLE